jgi:hypothetical protein
MTFLLVRGARVTCDGETSARSRRAERIRGEEVFDRGELPDALGRHGRGLTEDLILVRVAVLGIFFDLLAFESRKLGANFISRIHTPHFGDKSGKLPGERWMVMGRAGEIHQFLADRVVERRLESIALPDGSRRFALLDPNLMVFVRTHGLALAAIGLSERWIFSRAERHGNGFFRQPFGATLRAARRRPLSFTIDPGGHAAAIGRAPRRGDVRTDVRARAPFGSRKVQSAAGTRRVVAERIWGLWNETRHKPASRQAIFASRPARKCGLLNTILFERRATGRRQRLETRKIVSQKSLLIPVSQKRIIQTSCERQPMATKPTKTRRAAPRKRRKPAPSDKPKRHAWTRQDGEIHGPGYLK